MVYAQSGLKCHRGYVKDERFPCCCSTFSSLRYASSDKSDSARARTSSKTLPILKVTVEGRP